MSAPIVKYQNIVVQVTQNTTQFFFPDQPNLRGARIVGIEAQDENILAICGDLNTPNVPIATFRNAFVTLIVGDVNNVTKFPLQNLQTIQDNSNVAPTGRANVYNRDFNQLTVYWNKSYIEVPAAVIPAIGTGFNIGVFYYDPLKK
jgi:hypothetical protein